MHNYILLSGIFIIFQAVLSYYLIETATWDPTSLGFVHGNMNPNLYIFISIMPVAHGCVLQAFLTRQPSSACKAGFGMQSRIVGVLKSNDQNNSKFDLL